MRRRSIALFFVFTTIGLAPDIVRADDTGRVAAATVLFDEGVQLMEAGKTAEACEKLAKSQELSPNGGTLLALGECYEKLGRVASAWVAFREAGARAASAGKHDAEVKALDRAQKLEKRLPKITITAPEGVEVRRNNVLLAAAEIGLTTPVDPGTHEVRASAPGKKPFVKVVDVAEGIHIGIEIPPLEDNATASPNPETPVEPPSDGSTQRILGLGLAGAGIVAAGVGAAFGLMAKSDNDEALKPENCRTPELCTPRGLELTDDARSKALVSTILFIAGGVAVVGGAALYFTAPSGSAATSRGKPNVRFTPLAGPTGFGGAATLRF